MFFLRGMPTPAPSQPVLYLARSLRPRHPPPAVSVTSILEHMDAKARVLRDAGEDTGINDPQSPVGGVAALIPAGAAWRV